MSVQPLYTPSTPDWSTDLAKLGPQIAEEGRRCDAENRYVGANIATLKEHGFLGLAVPEPGSHSEPPELRSCRRSAATRFSRPSVGAFW